MKLIGFVTVVRHAVCVVSINPLGTIVIFICTNGLPLSAIVIHMHGEVTSLAEA